MSAPIPSSTSFPQLATPDNTSLLAYRSSLAPYPGFSSLSTTFDIVLKQSAQVLGFTIVALESMMQPTLPKLI